MNAPAKIETPSNTAIWDALCKTDPAHTKRFKRSGGFEGTAIKPIWMERQLTEYFGPCGIGWGHGKPEFQLVTVGEEILVFCTVRCWHGSPDNELWGVGGDKVAGKNKYGIQADDEAFKKAKTDAIGNAFKHIGCAADVHMGQFDDSKYVREVASEFADKGATGHSQGESQGAVSQSAPKGWREESAHYPNPSKLHKGLTVLERELAGCGDSDMVYGVTATDEWKEFVRVCEIHAPHYLRGGDPAPPEFEGLLTKAERLVKEFDTAIANHMTDLARA